MDDLREKVIKGLESCKPEWFDSYKCKGECPYDKYGHNEGTGCVEHLIDDAISLLKAQEPVKLIIKHEMDDVCSCIDNVAYCGKCGAPIGRLKQNYCSNCGQAVKWE